MIAFLRGILQPLQRISISLHAIITCLHTSCMDDLIHFYNSPQTYPLVSRVMSFASYIQNETLWDYWTIGGSALLIGLEFGYRFAEYQHIAAWSAQQFLRSQLVRFGFLLSWCIFAVRNEAHEASTLLAALRFVLSLAELLGDHPPEQHLDLVSEPSEVQQEDEDDYGDGHHYDPRYESDYESDRDDTQSKFF